MRTPSITAFLLILLFSIASCHSNRLKTDEKELAKELLKTISAKSENESDSKLSESGKERTKVFRKKEVRKIDPDNPPIRIDIPGLQSNTREFKLSDIASSIRYVKLQTPPDTALLYDHFFYRPDLDSKIRSDGEQIIFEGLFGLTRFNMQGEYQETIWKNETGIKFLGSSSVAFGGADFFGVTFSTPVSLSNGNLYFTFHDGPAGISHVMKYNSGTNKILSSKPQSEIPGPGIIPGETLLTTKKNYQERFEWIYGTSPDTWAGVNNKFNAGTTGSLMVTYNNNGDTLCQFTDFERIENFSFTTWRKSVDLTSYYFNGLLTIKQEYNDTLFRLIPPDRLLPIYIIDFGKYKLNFKDGLNPNFDLSAKLMLNSLSETNDYLFIRYTQNNDGLNNRKKNSVKFYNALFNKKESKLYNLPGFTLTPEGLENDLDGGMPFWPEFITPQGEMMKLVSGSVIKDYVNSAEFKKAKISAENRQKQISMASGLKPTDMIVIVVK